MKTAVACGIPSPQVGLKTSSTSFVQRMSKISCLIWRKIICALSKSKHVGKLFARRMYLVAVAKGSDGCLWAVDSFMAAQWKLLLMSNTYSSLTPFIQKSKALSEERDRFWMLDNNRTSSHTSTDWFFGNNLVAKALCHLLCFKWQLTSLKKNVTSTAFHHWSTHASGVEVTQPGEAGTSVVLNLKKESKSPALMTSGKHLQGSDNGFSQGLGFKALNSMYHLQQRTDQSWVSRS